MKLFKQIFAYILVLSILTVPVFAFPDVTEEYDWAESAIKNLSQQGYLNGYPDGTFAPQKYITRAEFTKLITLMFGNQNKASYKDVSSEDWFYPYVSQSGGYFLEADCFFPNQNITRQEVAYAIYNALKLTDSPLDKSISFRDMDTVDSEYVSAVKTLNRAEILQGYPDGSFGPSKAITRAEIATVLERAFTYEEPGISEKTEETENSENTEKETLKLNNYFFVVSRVSTIFSEEGELMTKAEGYQDGKPTTILIGEDTTITQSPFAPDSSIKPGDIISYSRNYFGEINRVSIGFNAYNLPKENRIKLLAMGNTTKRHIAAGIVKETYKEKGIELISLAGDTEMLYTVSNDVMVYELKSNGKIEPSDFLSIIDSEYETGDTVVAYGYEDVLYEIVVIKE